MNPFGALINNKNTSFTITSKPYSDFWVTPERHQMDGLFYPWTIEGDFNATIGFKGSYTDLYDQAGMMIYFSDDHWLKAGVELIGKVPHISAVTTKTYSDWSVIPINTKVPDFHSTQTYFQLSRRGHELTVSYQLNTLENNWIMYRDIHGFFTNSTLKLGGMLASPQSSTGFSVGFTHFQISQ